MKRGIIILLSLFLFIILQTFVLAQETPLVDVKHVMGGSCPSDYTQSGSTQQHGGSYCTDQIITCIKEDDGSSEKLLSDS